MPKAETDDQRRFTFIVLRAQAKAKERNQDIEIGYDPQNDLLFFCNADEHILDDGALQATIKPNGDICEAKTINPKFCEV